METSPEFHVAEFALALRSFYCACGDMFIVASRRRAPLQDVAVRIRESNYRHIAALVVAHGRQAVKPKHHWVYDLADDIEKDAGYKFVPDALPLERLHIGVKQVAANVRNTTVFERSVLEVLVCNHQNRLENRLVGDGLRGATVTAGDGVILAAHVEVASHKLAKGDVVFRTADSALAVVLACARSGGEFFVVVDELHDVVELSAHSVRAGLASATTTVWPVVETRLALAWYEGAPDELVAVW